MHKQENIEWRRFCAEQAAAARMAEAIRNRTPEQIANIGWEALRHMRAVLADQQSVAKVLWFYLEAAEACLSGA